MGTPRLDERIAARLAAVDDEGLRRTLKAPTGIDLSSNDYLGLSCEPRVIERLIAGVRTHGAGSTGSRLLRGEREATARLEARFATFKGTERALYFSSGYLANLAVVATFAEPGDLIVSDALNHASLIDGIRLARAERVLLPHADAGALARVLTGHRGNGQVFVVTESLFTRRRWPTMPRYVGGTARHSSWTRRMPWVSTAGGAVASSRPAAWTMESGSQ